MMAHWPHTDTHTHIEYTHTYRGTHTGTHIHYTLTPTPHLTPHTSLVGVEGVVGDQAAAVQTSGEDEGGGSHPHTHLPKPDIHPPHPISPPQIHTHLTPPL